VHTFEDEEQIYFDTGKFDEWCVYLRTRDGMLEPPRDEQYFAELQKLGHRYGNERIYSYFKAVYDLTDRVPRPRVFELISAQSANIDEAGRLDYYKLLVTLYYTMIAEENRVPQWRYPLRKRVKKIGVFQVLLHDLSPSDAAAYSRGMSAPDLRATLEEFEQEELRRGL